MAEPLEGPAGGSLLPPYPDRESGLEVVEGYPLRKGRILQTARDTKFKEETITYLDELAKEVFGLTR